MANRINSGTVAMVLSAFPLAAAAHPGHISSGFLDGLLHPLSGIDHLLAMVAIGLWAAQLGGRARWWVPASFVGFMLVGAMLAFAGLALPVVEAGIAASVLALGLLIAANRRLPHALCAVAAGTMALFHGYGHGAEIGLGASTAAYAGGFVVMTALLHVTGIIIAQVAYRSRREAMTRFAGAGIGAAGAWLLLAAQ